MNEETKTPDPEVVQEKKPASLPVTHTPADGRGMVLGSSLEERYRVCALYAKSGMLPKSYDTPEKVFAGIQYALELGFQDRPLMALKNIAMINGQPNLWGDLPQAMVLSSGKLEYFEEFFENKAGERLPETCSAEQVFAAICLIQRKGSLKKRFAYTQDDRTSLGVAAIWKSFTKIMMMRKARAAAHKAEFADVLHGISIAEYDHHIYLDDKQDKSVTVVSAQEEKLNQFKDKFKQSEVVVETEVVDGPAK